MNRYGGRRLDRHEMDSVMDRGTKGGEENVVRLPFSGAHYFPVTLPENVEMRVRLLACFTTYRCALTLC